MIPTARKHMKEIKQRESFRKNVKEQYGMIPLVKRGIQNTSKVVSNIKKDIADTRSKRTMKKYRPLFFR